MKIPTVHLNGSGKTLLLAGYHDAHAALRAAIEKMADITPHNRDYYVQTDDANAGRTARAEHQARMQKLLDVQRDIEALSLAVQEQGR